MLQRVKFTSNYKLHANLIKKYNLFLFMMYLFTTDLDNDVSIACYQS